VGPPDEDTYDAWRRGQDSNLQIQYLEMFLAGLPFRVEMKLPAKVEA